MLSRLRLWQGGTLDLDFEQEAAQHLPLPTLALGCCEPEAPLSELLGFLQPAGMLPRKFERLELSGELPDPAALAGCTHLGQLSELPVACKLQMPVQPVEFGAEPIALVVAAQVRQAAHACAQTAAALLQQASHLRSLEFGRKAGDAALLAVPACLAKLQRADQPLAGPARLEGPDCWSLLGRWVGV